MESPGGHSKASRVCDQEQSKQSFSYGFPLGEKSVAPFPAEDRTPKKGKGSTSPTCAVATSGQTPQKDGKWQLVEKKKKKKKKDKKVSVPSTPDPKKKRALPRRSQGVGEG